MRIKHLWNVLFIVLISLYSNAQNINWKQIAEKDITKSEKIIRESLPVNYTVFQIDLERLTAAVKEAPLVSSTLKSNVIISFPTTNGKTELFEVYNAPVMSAVLAAKYPNISSYSGKSLDDPTSNIRFSLTEFGFQAVHYSEKTGTNYIDSYTKDLKNYINYNRKDLTKSSSFNCLVNEDDFNTIENNPNLQNTTLGTSATPHIFREYRLALACTVEYATFHITRAQTNNILVNTVATKKAVVLSAMAATMTRVNFIYERDLAIRMNIIDNNDTLIFLERGVGYIFNNDIPRQLINQSQTVINNVIGTDNYDIGHTFSTGAGGVARLQSPCNSRVKAMGVTGIQQPIGDPFDVDYVAHEMGHQFGATHTFNNSCNDNIQPQTAIETGSGSTIMGYAGICPPNVQGNSDPFFHSVSIAQINAFKTTNGNCSENTEIEIRSFEADAGINYSIPRNTPFKLTASTNLNLPLTFTYSWEQTDNEYIIQPPESSSASGPLFRTLAPTQTAVRYFPKYEDVLTGVTTTWEVLPNVARTLNFNLIVRDNNMLFGGQTAEDNMQVTVKNVGPFTISYPDLANEEWYTETSQIVTWNVAGTTSNDINTSLVNILFSADNGQTFIPLKENTPNDGSEAIIVPDLVSDQCRILIEPVDNIYYAVSKNFKVFKTVGVGYFDTNDFKLYPNPAKNLFHIYFESNTTSDINIEIHDIKGQLIKTQTFKNTGIIDQEININQLETGLYFVTVQDGRNKVIKKLIKN